MRRLPDLFPHAKIGQRYQMALTQLLKQDSVKNKPIVWASFTRQNNYGQSIT